MGSHVNSTEEINSYLESLWLERGLAENTLSAYRRDLTDTANLLQTLGINQISAAREGIFSRFSTIGISASSVRGALPAG